MGRPLATDDTWWHLAMGALYAGGDLWPREDPLLHTTVLRAPVAHEWLFQVALHGVERLAGFAGLRALHVGVVAGIVATAFAAFRRASRDTAVAAAACVVLVALSWFRWVQLRPDLVSVLAILALYVLLLRDPAPPGRGRLAAGLLLLLLWVNAHSLFMIGLCLVLAAVLGTLLRALLARLVVSGDARAAENASRGLRLLAFLVLAIAVTWLNPRGFEQHLTFLTESRAGLIWKILDDFQPYRPLAPPQGGPAFTFLAWLVSDLLYATCGAAAARRLLRLLRERSSAALEGFDPVGFALALAAFTASLVAVRFHWLAVFPLLYLLRPLAAQPLSNLARAALAAASLAIAVALPGVAGVLPAFAAEVAREPRGYWRSDWLDVRYCGPGMRFLADAGLEGRLYHPFNLGGFLGYWLAPRLRTFIDGRLDHVPAQVLDDYLTIRRTSRLGPTEPLRARLDRWGVDLFFADTFPPAWYADRESGYALRQLPEWIPIWVTRTHAIYLRRSPRNQRNLARVAAYYAARDVPFDPGRGLDVSGVIDARPDWAAERQLVLPAESRLEALAEASDPALRARGLERLARHAWRVGDFKRQVDWDRALRLLRPEDRDAALRLGDGLLRLGRPRGALRVLAPLEAARPEDLEVARLAAAARSAAAVRARRGAAHEQTD